MRHTTMTMWDWISVISSTTHAEPKGKLGDYILDVIAKDNLHMKRLCDDDSEASKEEALTYLGPVVVSLVVSWTSLRAI